MNKKYLIGSMLAFVLSLVVFLVSLSSYIDYGFGCSNNDSCAFAMAEIGYFGDISIYLLLVGIIIYCLGLISKKTYY